MRSERDAALLELLQFLQEAGYHFVTPTPATHARVLSRKGAIGSTLQDAFGWSMPFHFTLLPPELAERWVRTEVLLAADDCFMSTVRVSSLDGRLFLHSPYPTLHENDVFFGPDTYRFARFLLANIGSWSHIPGCRIADIGCGSGAGGIVAASRCHDARLALADINPAALSYAQLNAAHNGLAADIRLSDLFSALPGEFDLIISNPPYLHDELGRSYRHGGGKFGSGLSLRIIEEGLKKLTPGGRLILYTGSAIESGADLLRTQVSALAGHDFNHEYQEIDVDVFGEELERPAYATIDRIAVVGLVMMRK